MIRDARLGFLVLVVQLLATAAAALAQQPSPPVQPGAGTISLDVVVTPKSGAPVAGLQQQDFTLLDSRFKFYCCLSSRHALAAHAGLAVRAS
jgi:hypothetical protein